MILVDNMAVVLATSRYRSKYFKLLAMIRRLATISLARGIKFHLRWIPSEFNFVDGIHADMMQPSAVAKI